MKAAAVINVGAGSNDEPEKHTHRQLSNLLGSLVPSESIRFVPAESVASVSDALIARGAEVLIAGGGDGTISTVAGIAARAGVTLGVLPRGTRNNFARDLGIPLASEDWVQLLRTCPIRQVDLGEVNGRLFINNVSIGLYPRIVEMREQITGDEGRSKRSAQMMATLRVLTRFPRTRCILRFPDHMTRRLTPVLFVGNNAYQAGAFPESRRPVMDAGLLWVCTARASGPLSLLPAVWHALRGRIDAAEMLDAETTPALEIEFRHPRVHAAVDGEPELLSTPLRLRSRNRLLSVVAP